MNEIIQIASEVYWLGAKHPQLQVFDELFPTSNGSTYNAYLVKGKDKTALIDTVKGPFTEVYLDRVAALVPLDKIDLLVVNHTEPDHSGALGELLKRNPNIEIYCSKAAENFLKQIHDVPMKTHAVSEGQEIDLGGKTLRFLLAPYLHWPDTIFTLLPEEKILFSCDAFGAHFCPERLFDDESPDFSGDFTSYFDVIMRPFKDKIREALAKVENLDLRMICPSHGPLLRRDPKAVIAAYKTLAAAPPEDGKKHALILSHSPHGNTRNMGAAVRRGLESRGVAVAEIAMYGADAGKIRDALEWADALVVATPTINRDAPPPVWQALALISTVTPKGRIGAVLGSYGWSGEAVKLVEERLVGLKYTLAAPGLHYRFTPGAEDIAACVKMGEQVAAALLGDK